MQHELAEFQRAHTFTGSLPTTVALGGSDIARYYQQFTRVAVPAVVNTGTGCSSTTLVPKLVADDFFAINSTSSLELVDAVPAAIGLFGLANNAASPVPIPLTDARIELTVDGPCRGRVGGIVVDTALTVALDEVGRQTVAHLQAHPDDGFTAEATSLMDSDRDGVVTVTEVAALARTLLGRDLEHDGPAYSFALGFECAPAQLALTPTF